MHRKRPGFPPNPALSAANVMTSSSFASANRTSSVSNPSTRLLARDKSPVEPFDTVVVTRQEASRTLRHGCWHATSGLSNPSTRLLSRDKRHLEPFDTVVVTRQGSCRTLRHGCCHAARVLSNTSTRLLSRGKNPVEPFDTVVVTRQESCRTLRHGCWHATRGLSNASTRLLAADIGGSFEAAASLWAPPPLALCFGPQDWRLASPAPTRERTLFARAGGNCGHFARRVTAARRKRMP